MCLLLQLNGDLPERFEGHERRIYIFACRSKACRKKAGAVRGIRGIRIQETSVEKHSKTHGNAKTNSFTNAISTQSNIGNSIFAPNLSCTSDGSNNPFSTSASASQNIFSTPIKESGSTGLESPFTYASRSQRALPEKIVSNSQAGLSSSFAEKARISPAPRQPSTKESWPSRISLPKPYASYSLDADYEYLDPAPPSLSKAKMDTNIDGISNSKDNDKEAFESIMDKAFQRFADRLAQNPEQVLRYEFGGMPLLYSNGDAVANLFSYTSSNIGTNGKITTQAWAGTSRIPSCPNCSKPRVFELQLVPQTIAELEADESGLDGMDWGTILMGVCSADCGQRGIRAGEWGWMEEWVSVQWEEDGKVGNAC